MITVDLFAGGGGASEGIRAAIGRDPDIAVNHDKIAIAVHAANHPGSQHFQQDIWKVHPRRAARGKTVGLLWASPDCTHFSKAKGSKPKRDFKRRSLAWVIEKWISEVHPRVLIMENVEEFRTWGPLDSHGNIVPSQKGTTFAAFIRRIKRHGYSVEHRELKACDYGAPTIRKRLFLIARCDGLPIVWPEPTHGPGLIPYRTAADIIDWSIPCPSIFDRKRPLVENTMRRISKGIERFVLNAADPFIVTYYGPKKGEKFRGQSIREPLRTQTTENRFGLVTPYIVPIQHYNGNDIVQPINEPLRTVTASPKGGGFAISIPHIQRQFGNSVGHAVEKPLGTVTAAGLGKSALVTAFLLKYYGTDQDPRLGKPLHTITTRDRFGLVTVNIQGEPYVITDIGMRMLSPRELYRAQGFDDDYRIDIEIDGKRITKTDQVRLCGNSVCPPIASAIINSNTSFLLKNKTFAAS